MNKRIKTYCPLIFWFILLAACHQSKVGTDSLVLALSDSGTVSGIDFGQKADVPVVAYTTLTGCKQQSGTKRIDERGYMTFERIFEDSAKNTCKVIDRFSKVPGAVIWEVEVQGSGKPWTTGINTVVNYPATEQSACWTTWSAMEKSNGQWRDPLRPKPFENLHLTYGGGEILDPNSMVIPMISVFENDGRTGFTVLQSLQDTILDLSLITDTAGRMVFKRENHKISRESTVRFKMHLFSHGLDWRSGLDFCTKTYPQYFNAVSKQTDRVAGGAAYSSWEGALDTAKLNQMGFKFNWKATFDFPYMGMFLPEVASTSERWERFHQGGVKVGDGFTSVDEMEGYMKQMRAVGYHVLCYFNLTEVGNHIVYPPPARKAKSAEDLWRDPNDFVYYTAVRNALLKRAGAENDSPVYSNWEGCVVVDPGEESYKKHLLTQARHHIDYLPSNSGICIDRLDWLREYNVKGDDGVSWKDNIPSRALLLSWKEIMNELGPMMHAAGKVIFANVLTSRIDILEHIDAVYDEYGHIPLSLNRSAFMTLRKPLIAWTSSREDIEPDPDRYFQRHLYLGAYLTVPYPGNDHTILPDPDIEKHYIAYGPMLKALKGKKWLLKPDVLQIEKGDAKVNIFENEHSYQIPVVFGRADHVMISLKDLETDFATCKVLYPGKEAIAVKPTKSGGKMCFDFPLTKGCAMLIINK